MDEIHHLAKVKVAGSNPVFRSKIASLKWADAIGFANLTLRFAHYPRVSRTLQ